MAAYHPRVWVRAANTAFSVSQPKIGSKRLGMIFKKNCELLGTSADLGCSHTYNDAARIIRSMSAAEDLPLVTKESKR